MCRLNKAQIERLLTIDGQFDVLIERTKERDCFSQHTGTAVKVISCSRLSERKFWIVAPWQRNSAQHRCWIVGVKMRVAAEKWTFRYRAHIWRNTLLISAQHYHWRFAIGPLAKERNLIEGLLPIISVSTASMNA